MKGQMVTALSLGIICFLVAIILVVILCVIILEEI